METITVDRQTQQRIRVLTELVAGAITTQEAAASLRLSVRQVERLRPRFRQHGAAGLVHGNRGRPPANRIASETRLAITEFARDRYRDFNFQQLTEMLVEVEGLRVSADTVRRACLEADIQPPRPQRRRLPRRQRRERCRRAGEMLQMDGTKHDWLEGRGPKLTLLNAIDDATGWKWAQFFEEETLEAYMSVLRRVVLDRGVPQSVYTDGISTITGGDTRFRRQPPVASSAQLRRALEELGAVSIVAGSAQAKGRVERTNGTDQDRLTSLLRLHKATCLAEARAILPLHLRDANRRFTVAPAEAAPSWLSRPPLHLDDILCLKEERTVARDNTVRVYGRIIDIPPGMPRRDYSGCHVQIHRRFDGSLAIHFQGHRIAGDPPRPKTRQPTKSLLS